MNKINIKETIEDKNSWFNVKMFDIKGLGSKSSKKTIDSTNITYDLLESSPEFRENNFIFQKSKRIFNFQPIKKIINESDNNKIKAFFGWSRWLSDKFNILTFTLDFNPYDNIKRFAEIEGFFQYFYEFSNNMLFIPNIKKNRIVYSRQNHKTVKSQIEIVSLDDYLKFVNDAFHFLESKNTKPIFVPISLKFPMSQIEQLIQNYIKHEYFYFWIDFESKPIDQAQTARIREINQLLKRSGQFDNVLLFFTNMKREIISKLREDKSPASDVLGTIYGANIVGIDKEPPKPMENPPKTKIIFEHKAREFKKDSYYYVKTRNPRFSTKEKNITNNSFELSKEFDKQSEHFLGNFEIENYLRTKQMINEFNNGQILFDLKKVQPIQSKIKNFFNL